MRERERVRCTQDAVLSVYFIVVAVVIIIACI